MEWTVLLKWHIISLLRIYGEAHNIRFSLAKCDQPYGWFRGYREITPNSPDYPRFPFLKVYISCQILPASLHPTVVVKKSYMLN